MELADLKKQYEPLSKKHNLPNFNKLNEEFEIDKIDRETDFLLRLIRKTMMEKIVNSLGFIEMLLNPVNAPRLYLGYIKSISQDDKEKIDKIYESLADLSLSSLALELSSDETKEAELISKIYNKWASLKPDFKKIMDDMKNPKSVAKKEKSYYG